MNADSCFRWMILTSLVGCMFFGGAGLENAHAQGLSKTLHRDQLNGFKFRPLSDCIIVPSQPALLEKGLLCRMDHEEEPAYIEVLRFEDRPIEPEEGEEEEEGEERSGVFTKRMKIEEYLEENLQGNFRVDRTKEDKTFKVSGNEGRWRVWNHSSYRIEVFTYLGREADFHLVYFLHKSLNEGRTGKRWISGIKKSGRSFDLGKRMRAADLATMSYSDLLKYHQKADKQFTDWRVTGTSSKQFIIKTSSDRGAFIKKVISQLERSRTLFERDFPPADFGQKMTAISIVRICGTEEEFHRYGDTRPGVLGWFNPKSEELVLFTGEREKDMDAITLQAMTHEAFHQYCHFLFKRSEAHRWFDEGQGDYYTGAGWFQGKVYIDSNPKLGISRLPDLKYLIKSGEMVPLEEHLNFTHPEWQSRGGLSYAQSWSIIYMLRHGTLGKVPSKYWKPEYATIIPNYMRALFDGYQERYAKILETREKKAKEEGRELTEDEKEVDRFDLRRIDMNRIWKKAMKASWGQIDLEEFETQWLDYFTKEFEL